MNVLGLAYAVETGKAPETHRLSPDPASRVQGHSRTPAQPSALLSNFHQTARSSEPLRRNVGLLVPHVERNEGGGVGTYARKGVRETGLLPGRDEGGRLPPHVRGAAADGRAERDLLPAAVRGATARVGLADAGRVPLRGEDEPPDHALRACRRDPDLLRAGAGDGRPARADPRPAPAHPAARRRA